MQTTTEGAARMFGRYWGEADIARTPEAFRCEAIDPKRTLTALKSRSAAALCPYCERLTLGLRVGTTPERGTPEQINGSK